VRVHGHHESRPHREGPPTLVESLEARPECLCCCVPRTHSRDKEVTENSLNQQDRLHRLFDGPCPGASRRHALLPQDPTGDPPDVLAAMTVDMVVDLLAVWLDGPRASGISLSVNWHFTDTNESRALCLGHCALNYVTRADPDATVTVVLTRPTLDAVLTEAVTMPDALAAGDVVIDGDAGTLVTLFGLLDPSERDFAIALP